MIDNILRCSDNKLKFTRNLSFIKRLNCDKKGFFRDCVGFKKGVEF